VEIAFENMVQTEAKKGDFKIVKGHGLKLKRGGLRYLSQRQTALASGSRVSRFAAPRASETKRDRKI